MPDKGVERTVVTQIARTNEQQQTSMDTEAETQPDRNGEMDPQGPSKDRAAQQKEDIFQEWIYVGHGEWVVPQENKWEMVQEEQVQNMTQWEILQAQTQCKDLMNAEIVSQSSYPNRYGARIPVKTGGT